MGEVGVSLWQSRCKRQRRRVQDRELLAEGRDTLTHTRTTKGALTHSHSHGVPGQAFLLGCNTCSRARARGVLARLPLSPVEVSLLSSATSGGTPPPRTSRHHPLATSLSLSVSLPCAPCPATSATSYSALPYTFRRAPCDPDCYTTLRLGSISTTTNPSSRRQALLYGSTCVSFTVFYLRTYRPSCTLRANSPS